MSTKGTDYEAIAMAVKSDLDSFLEDLEPKGVEAYYKRTYVTNEETCESKVTYESSAFAREEIARINKRNKKEGDGVIYKPQRIYRCDNCRFWHATSLPKP